MKKPTESYYFTLQASWGLTKHMGGLEATRSLAQACHIGPDSHVLDVGCGVGITACFLPKEYGCRLLGIDLSEKMIERSKERAVKKGVADQTEFQTANAADLPFDDGLFDAVICESVIAFAPDKQQVLDEFARVLKPGGYVGINEVTWLEPPPENLQSYIYQALGGAEFLSEKGWRSLLEKAGLKDISAEAFRTNAWRQWLSEARQMDPGDWLGAWTTFFSMFMKDPAVRRWVWEVMFPPLNILNLFRYFGYGLYVGRK